MENTTEAKLLSLNSQFHFHCLFARGYGENFSLTTHLAEKMEDANKTPAFVVMTVLKGGN